MKSKEKGTAVSLCLCCTLGGSCLGSAGGQDVGSRKLKLGGSHSGVQSRVASWDTVSGQRDSLIEAADVSRPLLGILG